MVNGYKLSVPRVGDTKKAKKKIAEKKRLVSA